VQRVAEPTAIRRGADYQRLVAAFKSARYHRDPVDGAGGPEDASAFELRWSSPSEVIYAGLLGWTCNRASTNRYAELFRLATWVWGVGPEVTT
jgi:hypothetical protein